MVMPSVDCNGIVIPTITIVLMAHFAGVWWGLLTEKQIHFHRKDVSAALENNGIGHFPTGRAKSSYQLEAITQKENLPNIRVVAESISSVMKASSRQTYPEPQQP